MPARSAAGKRRPSPQAGRVRLKPHDSFDLIRLLARSQSDARKALGELVQNSLDAEAARVEITWFNEKGQRALRIHDDGRGIFPGEGREEALRRLAQTIGHSHKRDLSPAERHRQMVLGKYGIGLLGFWCVARVMEIKSRVGGGETWVLRLQEDEPEAEVFPVRGRQTHDEETFTEITLREVKESVARQVRPARLQAYLAGELRGQLLQRGVEVRLHDRIARGRATKEFRVRPKAYLGLPFTDLVALPVPGHEDARVELYFVPPDEGRAGVVSLACGGSVVLDDLALVDPTDPGGARREPWCSGRLEGVIDFPDLEVAPGTRRGFVPNEAALDFLIALEKLENELFERLRLKEHERAAERRENLAREIRRAFAPVARQLPQYDLFDVRPDERRSAEPGTESRGPGAGAADSAQDEDLRGAELESPAAAPPSPGQEDGFLYPPGPLATLRIRPARLRLAPATERRLRAEPRDADGRPASGPIEYSWSLEGPGTLHASLAEALYRTPDAEGEARVLVEALQGDVLAAASCAVQVRESSAANPRVAGIPEPQPVDLPSESWRSRMQAGRWEYNEGHSDYRAVADDEPRRLRYLIHLFAKEVVLKNFGRPADEELLERMVEVLTHLGEGRGR
jgi:hypothetical protein